MAKPREEPTLMYHKLEKSSKPPWKMPAGRLKVSTKKGILRLVNSSTRAKLMNYIILIAKIASITIYSSDLGLVSEAPLSTMISTMMFPRISRIKMPTTMEMT